MPSQAAGPPSPVSFTDDEKDFLKHSRLGRIATTSGSGQPHVVPVGFDFDGTYFYVGGHNFERSLKFRHLQQNNRVTIVVDELVSTSPWRPRGIEVRGLAELVRETSHEFAWGQGSPFAKITPLKKVAWGF